MILEKKKNQVREFILPRDKKKWHRSFFILFGYRSSREEKYKKAKLIGELAYMWDYCFIPADLNRYRDYSTKWWSSWHWTGYQWIYYYRYFFMKSTDDLDVFGLFSLELLADYITVYSYYYRNLMKYPYHHLINIRDNLNLNLYWRLKNKKKIQKERLVYWWDFFLRKELILNKKEFKSLKKNPKYRLLIEKIKKETKIIRSKNIFLREIPDLFNFMGDEEEIKKEKKINMDFIKEKTMEWCNKVNLVEFSFDFIEEKYEKKKKKLVKKFEEEWIKKKKIDILDETFAEKRKQISRKLEKKAQNILTKDLYILWYYISKYSIYKFKFRDTMNLNKDIYRLNNYEFIILDYLNYKIHRLMVIKFYLLGLTQKGENKIKWLLSQSKLFNLFLHLKRDQQKLEKSLYRRVFNIDFRYKEGISEIRWKMFPEINENKMLRKSNQLNKKIVTNLEGVWKDLWKRLNKKKQFKKKYINWAKPRNKLNTLFSSDVFVKKWNAKRGNFFKLFLKKAKKNLTFFEEIIENPLKELWYNFNEDMLIYKNEFMEEWYYPLREDFYHQLTIEARGLRELNEENISTGDNFIKRLRVRWADYFDKSAEEFFKKVKKSGINFKEEVKEEPDYSDDWAKNKEAEWDKKWKSSDT